MQEHLYRYSPITREFFNYSNEVKKLKIIVSNENSDFSKKVIFILPVSYVLCGKTFMKMKIK